MTGLELLKAPATTAEEIADIISAPCPPVVPTECDRLYCRECWLAWRQKYWGRPINRRPGMWMGCTPTSSSTCAGRKRLNVKTD